MELSKHWGSGRFIFTATALALTAASAAQEQRVERLEYDPVTRQWREQAPPDPSTPEGALLMARRESKEDPGKARKSYQDWIKANGEAHPLYPEALFGLADTYFLDKDYYKANERFLEFTNKFSGHELAERAVNRRFIIAESFLAGKRRKLWGVPLLKADDIGLDILDDLMVNNPDSSVAELAIKTKADFYFKTGEFRLAEDEYGRLAREFPRSRYLRYAMFQTAVAASASFHGPEFDDAPLIEADEKFRLFQTQFPEYAAAQNVGVLLEAIRAKRAEKELLTADYYRRTHHEKAALFYYRSTVRSWPGTIAAEQAEARLVSMKAPLSTDSTSTPPSETDETPVAPLEPAPSTQEAMP